MTGSHVCVTTARSARSARRTTNCEAARENSSLSQHIAPHHSSASLHRLARREYSHRPCYTLTRNGSLQSRSQPASVLPQRVKGAPAQAYSIEFETYGKTGCIAALIPISLATCPFLRARTISSLSRRLISVPKCPPPLASLPAELHAPDRQHVRSPGQTLKARRARHPDSDVCSSRGSKACGTLDYSRRALSPLPVVEQGHRNRTASRYVTSRSKPSFFRLISHFPTPPRIPETQGGTAGVAQVPIRLWSPIRTLHHRSRPDATSASGAKRTRSAHPRRVAVAAEPAHDRDPAHERGGRRGGARHPNPTTADHYQIPQRT